MGGSIGVGYRLFDVDGNNLKIEKCIVSKAPFAEGSFREAYNVEIRGPPNLFKNITPLPKSHLRSIFEERYMYNLATSALDKVKFRWLPSKDGKVDSPLVPTACYAEKSSSNDVNTIVTYKGVLKVPKQDYADKLREEKLTPKDFQSDVEALASASQVANVYNAAKPIYSKAIKFATPIWLEIMEPMQQGWWSSLFSRKATPVQVGDILIVEPLLPGEYRRFDANNVNFSPNFNRWITLSAYTHLSWVHSKGEMLITDLQGVRNEKENVYLATDPIKTTADPLLYCKKLKGEGGETQVPGDFGPFAVQQFFQGHQCNGVCKQLGIDNEKPSFDFMTKFYTNGPRTFSTHTTPTPRLTEHIPPMELKKMSCDEIFEFVRKYSEALH